MTNLDPLPISHIEEQLNYRFTNQDLLLSALTHKSFFNENPGKILSHNERLEFLGDAVLDLSLSDTLMTQLPDVTEGELSKIRASLVNEEELAQVARELQIDRFLKLGKGEKAAGGAEKPRLLASALEAVIGAIYKDSDFAPAHQAITHIFSARISALDLTTHYKSDYKTRLQEKLQSTRKLIPSYEVTSETGPDHDKVFSVAIKLNQQVLAQGQGRTKKQAEQAAAKAAFDELNLFEESK